jgi:hypothetical protein
MVGDGVWRNGTEELRREYWLHQGRGYCNRCYHRHRRGTVGGACQNQQPIADLIEDVEWLRGTDSPENIAARVGYPRVASLARRLERADRPDLARIFDRQEMAS